MARGRPALPIGTYGAITVSGDLAPYKARARFRDFDGAVRTVAKFADTKGKARTALLEALRDRQHSQAADTITPNTTVRALAEAWMQSDQFKGLATNTQQTYRYIIANEVQPALGGVRLAELRLAVVNRALTDIVKHRGPGAAKTTKTVLTGMCGLAIAYEALDRNPIRDTIRIPRPRKAVRALTVDETTALCDALRSDERAVELDLPDLAEWMLGTGARIGECLAARDASLDLDAGTWEINATLIRIKGQGLHVQPRPKTAAGWRVLALPPFAVAMARRRDSEAMFRTDDRVLFGAHYARRLRDPSNTSGDLREVLDRLGFGWVTSHTFRKTVATRLDEAGQSARVIADQLGHAKPSMTQDVYMGRNVVSAAAASILER